MPVSDADREEKRVEVALGNLLRWGTILASTVVAIGGVVYLAHHGRESTAYATFVGEPPELRSIREIAGYAFELKGRGIIQLGLLLLVATPIARVIAALIAFAWERDVVYVIIASIVLAALVYGLLAS